MKRFVRITDYSRKGHGVASLVEGSGRQGEIVGTVVGDEVEVAVGKRRRRGLSSCDLLRVVTPSPDRVSPRCIHAGICGGCSWQQVRYDAQLKVKEDTVRRLFSPFIPAPRIHPIIPAVDRWEYRNKMEFSFSENRKGDRFLGLIMAQSRGKVLNITECHLVGGWYADVLDAVRDWWASRDLRAFRHASGTGTLRTLTLREGTCRSKMVILTVSGTHESFVDGKDLGTFTEAVLRVLPEAETGIYLTIHQAKKGRPSRVYEMHVHGRNTLEEEITVRGKRLRLTVSPSSFFQPNRIQAERVYEKALSFIDPDPAMRLYDLYAGCGVAGMLFAPFVKKVVGIELSAYAVCDARENMRRNGIDNMVMIRGDVEEVLEEFRLPADYIVVDPPRAGLSARALARLVRREPKKILYISCNPATQTDNVSELARSGYLPTDVQPVDLFPHTPHVENLSLLVKRP
ncbi:MAG: 23S rRNA (uracil(1939)-C(5))-methyltransferase RlmD [Simkaniaceae bacterium]|nr:23S rRNA (uracil(1939)-C(5))-methyltransferase RlmD [Simkaniaceae bacterium]